MKATPTVLCRSLLLALLTSGPWVWAADVAAEIRNGDTAAAVVAKLGEPQGMLQMGRSMTYVYDRGMVDFLDGRVVRSDVVTPAEVRQIRLERDRLLAAIDRQAASERNRSAAEGALELQKIAADASFTNRPAADRVAFWLDFSRRYPFNDVGSQIAAARTEAAAAQVREEARAELARLTARGAAIQERFKQLDADYAASLAHWKRNEIDAERAALQKESNAARNRIGALEAQLGVESAGATRADTGNP